ncbi:hypothetical protein CS022_04690 [Veronia nyctiphanis]|uniref:DUF2987 domain-containing protein n=1 Tax=Veronia nyctiphanis TaxID=1278244 RepID=A0A4Q0YSX1_9GAMM|nr:DUF2987 domain-containing protein [Veronia nyctiphanis]RXJ74350.1 hypothetical protein CS022_04690 [Veronia nyctiphanis]
MKRHLLGLLVTLLPAFPAFSAQYEFSYNKLFSQLKYNNAESHPDVKVGYFMVNPISGETCQITKAWMSKKANYEAFVIPASQELPLPIDRHLKKVNPDVFVETKGEQVCDISYQVMAEPKYNAGISSGELSALVPQMNAIMDDLGGMLSSWFMPEVKGITVHFDQDVNSLTTTLGNVIPATGRKVFIRPSDLVEDESVLFSVPPDKITPWLPSD